jgi:hypothetical protein
MISLSTQMKRGETGYGGETIDSNNLLFGDQIGGVRAFPDINPSTGVVNSGLETVAMLCRNKIGSALLPGQAVLLSATVIGETGATVTQTGTPNVFFGIVDEYLPSAGVPANDIFWLVLRGPTTPLITTSGGVSAGQLFIPSGTNNGKLDIIDATPDDSLEAMNQAIYATAVAIGTIASGATSARLCLRGNMYGQ